MLRISSVWRIRQIKFQKRAEKCKHFPPFFMKFCLALNNYHKSKRIFAIRFAAYRIRTMLSPTYSLILPQHALPCKACHSRFTLIRRLCAYRANHLAPSFSLLSARQFYCCAVCILFFISTFGVPFIRTGSA